MSEEDDGIAKGKRPPKKTARSKPKQYIGPDGVRRLPKVEHNLNEAFSIVFRGAVGKTVLDYLKSVTTNRVLEPGLPENTYSYQEGARWLMGVISTRIKDGEDKKP
jgi:hypothetical protein